MLSTGYMTVVTQILNSHALVLLLDRHHLLVAMRLLDVKRNLGQIPQNIQAPHLVLKDRVTICETKAIKLNKLASKALEILCHNSTSADLMNTIPNFANAFENKCNKKLVSTKILDIAKDMTGFDLLMEITAQS